MSDEMSASPWFSDIRYDPPLAFCSFQTAAGGVRVWIGRSSGTTRHAGFSSATDDLGQRRSDGPHPDGAAAREMAPRHPRRVELVPTDEGEGRALFRAAVLGLLDGLADDARVYWCIDDRYVMWLDHAAAEGCRPASRCDRRLRRLRLTRSAGHRAPW